ncbi:Putative ribonuclease H protein [Dendrobium catenatum]|uniref:Ribonuclease H protein n=1 Tax=Dendrobium catenatum TaxID=906689 RepID=A0A2I0VZ73_9ASPA|nr:Putative ribonuclease H protein [Dendrobium catenatum]
MGLNGDSISGPDGYTSKFFQKCWDIVKTDVIDAVNEFFKDSPFPKFFTSTSIVLIPKIDGANKWKDFRPISLCSFFNKIISKIISKRLESFLPRLDISKAYDNLNWDFCYKVLSLFCFSASFINLIKNCIDNCYFSIIINGRTHGFFKSSKGLRQGDNISPVLFIISMEYLSRGIEDLYLKNPKLNFRTIRGMSITHLCFADDFILFSNGSINNIKILNNFIINFNDYSGLSINKDKSSFIIGKSINRDRITAIQRICGFHSKRFPIKYLGTPIFNGKKRSHLFEDIFTFFQNKLNHWSSSFLSFGGRLILIKSVLNSIPIYLFHMLQPTASICLRIERMINKFFWGSKFNTNGIRWASWSNMCGIYNEGGLGCKNLSNMAQAFSHKLWFSFRSKVSLWARFMNAKYCKDKHPLLGVYKASDSLTWKRLCKIKWEANQFVQWSIGKGNVFFWQDNWLGPFSIDNLLNTTV